MLNVFWRALEHIHDVEEEEKKKTQWWKKATISVVILFTPRNAQTNVVKQRAGTNLEYSMSAFASLFSVISFVIIGYIAFANYHSSSISPSYMHLQ